MGLNYCQDFWRHSQLHKKIGKPGNLDMLDPENRICNKPLYLVNLYSHPKLLISSRLFLRNTKCFRNLNSLLLKMHVKYKARMSSEHFTETHFANDFTNFTNAV